jgi:hypothetical protein
MEALPLSAAQAGQTGFQPGEGKSQLFPEGDTCGLMIESKAKNVKVVRTHEYQPVSKILSKLLKFRWIARNFTVKFFQL